MREREDATPLEQYRIITAARLVALMEEYYRVDDELRREHAQHDDLIGQFCRRIEAEMHEEEMNE